MPEKNSISLPETVVDGLGKAVDGLVVILGSVIGETGGEVVVAVEGYLFGIQQFVEIVGSLVVLVEVIL